MNGKKVLILATTLLIASSPVILFASGSQIELQVNNCNNNGICEPQFGENYPACPLDCSAPTSTPPNNPSPPPSGIAPPAVSVGNENPVKPKLRNDIDPSSVRVYFPTSGQAVIEWNTNVETTGLLSWGKSVDVEIGTISEIGFGISHHIELLNIEPDTRYDFRIETIAEDGNISYLGPISFITPSELKPSSTFAPSPSNVSTTPTTSSSQEPSTSVSNSILLLLIILILLLIFLIIMLILWLIYLSF